MNLQELKRISSEYTERISNLLPLGQSEKHRAEISRLLELMEKEARLAERDEITRKVDYGQALLLGMILNLPISESARDLGFCASNPWDLVKARPEIDLLFQQREVSKIVEVVLRYFEAQKKEDSFEGLPGYEPKND